MLVLGCRFLTLYANNCCSLGGCCYFGFVPVLFHFLYALYINLGFVLSGIPVYYIARRGDDERPWIFCKYLFFIY
jgi:hypothetical protein